jgi:chromate transporter
MHPQTPRVQFADAFRFWLRLGFINFGGPAGQIAIMHRELVERRRWISEDRFLHALNFCMMLPGPEAMQLAIYIGWLLHRTLGGLVAGILFVMPGFVVMLALSWVYAIHGDVGWLAAAFFGLRAAVIALVAEAVLRIGARALGHPLRVGIAAVAFVAIFFLNVPFPVIVIAAAVFGLAADRMWPSAFAQKHGDGATAATGGSPVNPSLRGAAMTLAAGLIAWWGPLLAVIAWRGWQDVLAQQAVFFSKAAVVTFGGAYAVLAYIAQAAVEWFGWLQPGEMLDGLGLAESTPGPLIMVTQFVGYLGAYRNPGDLDPAVAGLLGAVVTTWATFAPCFLWIFLGAPFIERLRGQRTITAALSAVTAAVVGVILNLSVWLAIQTLFAEVGEVALGPARFPMPQLQSVDGLAVVLTVVAFWALTRLHIGVVPLVLASAAAGLVARWLL